MWIGHNFWEILFHVTSLDFILCFLVCFLFHDSKLICNQSHMYTSIVDMYMVIIHGVKQMHLLRILMMMTEHALYVERLVSIILLCCRLHQFQTLDKQK